MRYIILTKTDRAKLNRFKTELIRLKKIEKDIVKYYNGISSDDSKADFIRIWNEIDDVEIIINNIKNVRGIGKKVRKPTINASWEPIPKGYTGKNIKKAFEYATIEFTNNGWRFI